MTRQTLTVMAGVILLAAGTLAGCSSSRNMSDSRMETIMTTHAGGTFEVTLTPEGAPDVADGTTMGRMSIDKTFHGDLEATSVGAMLSVRTGTDGSAGYVALERVSGSLHGLTGGFVLHHSGTMTRGEPGLIIQVVPDSGSGQLKGLVGTMTIDIVDGKHFYEFDYAIRDDD